MFDFDDNAIFSAMIIHNALKTNDTKTVKLIKIFNKYGISVLKGYAMLNEISSLYDNDD